LSPTSHLPALLKEVLSCENTGLFVDPIKVNKQNIKKILIKFNKIQ